MAIKARAAVTMALFCWMPVACSSTPPPPLPVESIYWQRMNQLCGEVQLGVATMKVIRTQEGKIEERLYETPLPNAKIVLYKAVDLNTACCNKAQRIGETVSNRYGRFEFHGNPAGHYWLVVYMKDREVHVPVIAEAYKQENCEEVPYASTIITVDSMPYPKVEMFLH
ncbi:MAG: hypothetical protein ACRD5I_03275 [Candidatus Acidiferrales bacterium]